MRFWLFGFMLLPHLITGAETDFNGRWDITVDESERNRAWWLKVEGAGTKQISGQFVGAPGGGLDEIPQIAIERDELIFKFKKAYHGGPDKALQTGVYRAKLAGGRLEGTFQIEGEPATTKWVGVRAPKLVPGDLSKLKKGSPIELFNGRDLTGWKPSIPNHKMAWEAVGGITKNLAGAVDLVTDQKFSDFLLHAEYRIGPKSNSGIGLRGRYEVQILEDHGRPPSKHSNGALYSRFAPTMNASKPAGEWQAFDITLIGNEVTIVLNGTTVVDRKQIEGLTAIAVDPNESEPGPIVIQGDHGPVEFRKLTLTPLVKK